METRAGFRRIANTLRTEEGHSRHRPRREGKSTFAKLLSGQLLPWVFGDSWKYDESIAEETFSLRPAVRKLAQYASGLIESARIPQLDKIELQLRLAELEFALEIATETIR